MFAKFCGSVPKHPGLQNQSAASHFHRFWKKCVWGGAAHDLDHCTSPFPSRQAHYRGVATPLYVCIPRWSHTVPERHVHRLLNNFYWFIKDLLKHGCHFSCRFHPPSLPSASSPCSECLRAGEGQSPLGFTSWSQCKAHAEALEPLGICRLLFEDWRFPCPLFLPLAMNCSISTDTHRSPSAKFRRPLPSLPLPQQGLGSTHLAQVSEKRIWGSVSSLRTSVTPSKHPTLSRLLEFSRNSGSQTRRHSRKHARTHRIAKNIPKTPSWNSPPSRAVSWSSKSHQKARRTEISKWRPQMLATESFLMGKIQGSWSKTKIKPKATSTQASGPILAELLTVCEGSPVLRPGKNAESGSGWPGKLRVPVYVECQKRRLHHRLSLFLLDIFWCLQYH